MKDSIENKDKEKINKDNDNIKTNLDFKKIENQIDIKEELKDIKQFVEYLKNHGISLEDLELLQYIASGSISNTYTLLYKIRKKGRNINKKVLMKLIFCDEKEKEERKEVYSLSVLKNSNIINFYGYSEIEKDKTYYIIMDYSKYGNLRKFQRETLKRKYFSESMICFLAFQILKGIYYCHKCKIAHMDIKAPSIVIDDYLNAKLIDFSLSINYKNRDFDDEIKLPLKGTNFYISIEILKSKKITIRDLNKVDLYAFGVVLYNLAFGTYPYGLCKGDEDNYNIILKKIENGKLIFPNTSDYSSHFLDLLSRLLEKDINKRINIYEALNHYWIKGAKILLDEKEKCFNAGIFITYLLSDHIRMFNNYIKLKLEKN